MSTLFINGCFRKGSRTLIIAQAYLKKIDTPINELKLGEISLPILDNVNTEKYCTACVTRDFSDNIFEYGKLFAQAEEIVIAAPFWNYSIPAQLHAYLELVCSQGVTFDIDADGSYHSLCKAKKLTYITTAGGYIPEADHAWAYIRDLAKVFWDIKNLNYIKAEGLDIAGNDVEKIIETIVKKF